MSQILQRNGAALAVCWALLQWCLQPQLHQSGQTHQRIVSKTLVQADGMAAVSQSSSSPELVHARREERREERQHQKVVTKCDPDPQHAQSGWPL
jgi:hypothetical protein